MFETHGFAPLQADYLAAWLHTGQRVQFLQGEDRSIQGQGGLGGGGVGQGVGGVEAARAAGEGVAAAVMELRQSLTTLTIQGLSTSGFLLAVEEAREGGGALGGRRFELAPDGNSLDMMAGLVRRKL